MADTKLDLGCGIRKKEGFTGIDITDYTSRYKPDEFICGMIPDIFAMFKDESIEEVYCHDFMEHLPIGVVIIAMNEIYRILKQGRVFEMFVPHTGGRGAFCDPTHQSFWNDLSFRYYDMTYARWLSESYGIKCDFEILENRVIDEFTLHAILRKR